eukprot:TRINITY_DN1599_c0_g1_i6.p1 TRINITY_DN1599_c0_g1~~TRINITY_DN1599_c0_g1_i6.p1  ORF type:complete len:616 (-),score=166.53 TRINITY_DN1599_c0_g1_i6:106-1953(-)
MTDTVHGGSSDLKAMDLKMRTGVYIPPARLAAMRREITDKRSVEYQRLSWDALKKSINGLINKVNASNIKHIAQEIFGENLIRGKGLFARSCIRAQAASPNFTNVFAAIVAVVNSRIPEIGQLVLKRLILTFRKGFRRNTKAPCISSARFLAHLVNQSVCHEIVALQILTLLLEKPTDDSVEIAVGFVKECGQALTELTPQGIHGIFERFRGILYEGQIDRRVQYMIEGLFIIRKTGFPENARVAPELDVVEEEDQCVHEISLDDELDPEEGLDIFHFDEQFEENEEQWEETKKEILGEDADDNQDSEDQSGSDDDDEEEGGQEAAAEASRGADVIQDMSGTDLVNLRRTIYLTYTSSATPDEFVHKVMKLTLKPGQEKELASMIIECCAQERTFQKFFGHVGYKLCNLDRVAKTFQDVFDDCFVQQYQTIHRLETNKLRNVAKFFAMLLYSDAISWAVLSYIHLTAEDTTAASRIFIKYLFQEMAENIGLSKLNERLQDSTMAEYFKGIFPTEHPKDTRFAINFFSQIGLGGLTEKLRQHLANRPAQIMAQAAKLKAMQSDSSSSSDSSDSSDSDSSDSSDSDSSDSSDSDSSSSSDSSSESESRRKKARTGKK